MSDKKLLAEAIYQMLKDGSDRKKLAENIAGYLQDTRSSGDVISLLREVESLRLSRDDILEIDVISARNLSDSIKDMIIGLFSSRNSIVHEEIDPALIGGVKVRAHDKQLDYSVRTRLQRLKAGA